ncbi:methylated-DNA--[protein]-cysteine S-methyltransferase [Agrobacterium salinitolerans]|nr:methylated-DNA--[protein]-cysteine S-methyltransferase [Agrobacterium salinitolerans]
MGKEKIGLNGYAVGNWTLGSVLVGYRCGHVAAVLLGDDETDVLDQLHTRLPELAAAGACEDGCRVIEAMASGDVQALGDVPLATSGTAFQKAVWEAIREIPSGQTSTYAKIAYLIGRPKAVRAVASACGANPIAILVPCHRVVRRDGKASGYAWGIERKVALLEREMRLRRHSLIGRPTASKVA